MYYEFHFEQHLTVVAITGVSGWARDFGQEPYGDFQPAAMPTEEQNIEYKSKL
jgi:hypothetical protein